MNDIKFGPAGLGSIAEAKKNIENFSKLGLKACEIAFTYGAYIKKQEDAEEIGLIAKNLGIELSIHAHYWINLNSTDKVKIEQSKARILECCKVGTWLGAKSVVFHPGFYGKMDKETTYNNIKSSIIDILAECKKHSYTPLLCPETMGKVNVFGSFNEIMRLVDDTGCSFCVDFAHILAREKQVDYEKIFTKLKNYIKIHVHFSGIVYNEKGERHHIETPNDAIKELLKNIEKYASNKSFVIINESPNPVQDSVKSLQLMR